MRVFTFSRFPRLATADVLDGSYDHTPAVREKHPRLAAKELRRDCR